MRTKILLVTIVLLLTASAIPRPVSDNSENNYNNYLFSLDVLKCDDTVATGESGSINVKVGARTEVDLHIEFKGKYQWGHWTFSSEKFTVEPGVNMLKEEFSVPQGSLDDPALNYYIYVYVTMPGDTWNSMAWGLTRDVNVILPEPDKSAEIGVHGPGFGYYYVGDVKWSGVVWAHYDEAGSPYDPQGVWEVGIEGLPELWYTMCIVDRAECKQHVLVAEGTFLDEPLLGLDFTYVADLTSNRWMLEGEVFYFTGFIETYDT
jgi:hypothetical protein